MCCRASAFDFTRARHRLLQRLIPSSDQLLVGALLGDLALAVHLVLQVFGHVGVDEVSDWLEFAIAQRNGAAVAEAALRALVPIVTRVAVLALVVGTVVVCVTARLVVAGHRTRAGLEADGTFAARELLAL